MPTVKVNGSSATTREASAARAALRETSSSTSRTAQELSSLSNGHVAAPGGAPRLDISPKGVESAVNIGNLGVFLAFIGSYVVAAPFKFVAWGTGKFKATEGFSERITTMLGRMGNATVGGIAGAPFSAVQWVGNKADIGVLETAGSAPKKWAFNTAEAMSTRIGKAADAVIGYSGLAARRTAHVASLSTKATAAHTGALGHLDNAINALDGSALKTIPGGGAEAVEVATKQATGLQQALREAHANIKGKAGTLERKEVEAATKGLREELAKISKGNTPTVFQKAWGFLRGKNTDNEFTAVERSIDAFETEAHAAVTLASKANFRGNFATSMKKLPTQLAEKEMTSALHGGMYYGGQAITAFSTGHALLDPLTSMKHAYLSMTGKHASTMQVLFGSGMPDAVKQMRREYFLHAPAHAALNIFGMVVYAKTHHTSGSLFTPTNLLAGISNFSDMGFTQLEKNTLTTAYGKVQQAFQEKGELPVGAYAALMMNASPEVKKLGVDHQDVIAMARGYAANKTSPAQVLADLNNHAAGFKQKVAMLPKAAPQEVVSATEPPSTSTAWQTKVGQHTSPTVGAWADHVATSATAPALAGGRTV